MWQPKWRIHYGGTQKKKKKSYLILSYLILPAAASHIRQTRVSQAHAQRVQKEWNGSSRPPTPAQHPSRSVRHFVQTSRSLLNNPCFVFICLSMVTEGISLSGVSTFMPKMIEKKFRVSASWAAMLSGMF